LDDTFECWYGAFGRVRSSKSSVKVKQIAVGYNNTCAIKLDGSVQCWKIFDDKDESMLDMPNGLIAKKIAVGDGHACALRLNNTVTCWGLNIFAQAEPPEGLMAKEVVVGGNKVATIVLIYFYQFTKHFIVVWQLNLLDYSDRLNSDPNI
jgi:alpha-tubulin suppressor-like RCC1 family protein